jgi:hypothetical protein
VTIIKSIQELIEREDPELQERHCAEGWRNAVRRLNVLIEAAQKAKLVDGANRLQRLVLARMAIARAIAKAQPSA